MDRLVAEGTVFLRAYANFAWCAPSRNSFMSGRRPDTTRAWDFEHHFRTALPNATTLPQMFKQAGWWSSSVGKVYHPNLPPNCDGERSWSDVESYPVCGPNKPGSPSGFRNWSHQSAGGAQKGKMFDDCDAGIVDMALPRLAEAAHFFHNSSRPFFLAVGLRSVHIPYHYPPRFGDLYPPADQIAVAAHPLMDASQPLLGWYDQQMFVGGYKDVHASGALARGRAMNSTQQQIVRRNYYAATSYSDAQLGRLLNALDEYGVANSTLVVCFGDHGQQLGEHNLWEKMSVFEAATRVPLVVRAPWVNGSAGRAVFDVVELVSLYRSLAELSGVPSTAIEPGVEGTSFAPLIAGGAGGGGRGRGRGLGAVRGEQHALSQMTRCAQKTPGATQALGYYPCTTTAGGAMLYTFQGYSVRSAEWRFTLWARWNATTLCPEWGSPDNQMELYDHRNDTEALDLDDFENVNVAASSENAGVVKKMMALVRTRFGSANCSQREAMHL